MNADLHPGNILVRHPKVHIGQKVDLKEARENVALMAKRVFAVKCKGYRRGTDIGEVLRGVLSICRKHHVTVPANYATLVMNALCLDGMARSLLPGYNVLDSAEALLRLNKVVAATKFAPVVSQLAQKKA